MNSPFRLRVLRAASIAGRWTEAGAVVVVASEFYACVLAKRRIAEPADKATAERIAPLVRNVPTRALKRAAWREQRHSSSGTLR